MRSSTSTGSAATTSSPERRPWRANWASPGSTRRWIGLSGGQRTRAALAAIVLARFDVLLLDEPTNNLDADALERLEAFVAGFSGGIVVVSHDRAFLDSTVNRFVELDPFTRRASEFAGSWSEYVADRERRRQPGAGSPRCGARRARPAATARAGDPW